MYREANRASFLGRNGSSCLATTYGKLVAIELTIKDHMGASAKPEWRHNLPVILTSFATHCSSSNPTVSTANLNSLASQLANNLARFECSGVSGNRQPVPRSSYPHMRYIFHEWDGSHPTDTKESDIHTLDLIADNIIHILQRLYGVHP